MNKIFEGENTTIHDDRTPITITEAADILLSGGVISINLPPNFSAENEYEIYDQDQPITINEIIPTELAVLSKLQQRMRIVEYLEGYELYKF